MTTPIYTIPGQNPFYTTASFLRLWQTTDRTRTLPSSSEAARSSRWSNLSYPSPHCLRFTPAVTGTLPFPGDTSSSRCAARAAPQPRGRAAVTCAGRPRPGGEQRLLSSRTTGGIGAARSASHHGGVARSQAGLAGAEPEPSRAGRGRALHSRASGGELTGPAGILEVSPRGWLFPRPLQQRSHLPGHLSAFWGKPSSSNRN